MGENLQRSGTSSVFEDEDGDGTPFFDAVQFVEDLEEYDDEEVIIDTEICNLDPPHIVEEDDQPVHPLSPRWKSRALNCLVTFVSCTTLHYDERTGKIKPGCKNKLHALDEEDAEYQPLGVLDATPKKKKKEKGKKTTALSSPSAPLQSITGLLNSPSAQQKKRKRQTQSSGEEETGVSSSREVAATATARPSTRAASTTARAQRIEDFDITAGGPDQSDDDDAEEQPSKVPPPRKLSKSSHSPFLEYINNPKKDVPKEYLNWMSNSNIIRKGGDDAPDIAKKMVAKGEEHGRVYADVDFKGPNKKLARILIIAHFPSLLRDLMENGILNCTMVSLLPMNFTVHVTLHMFILVVFMVYGLKLTNVIQIIMNSVAWVDTIPYFFDKDAADPVRRKKDDNDNNKDGNKEKEKEDFKRLKEDSAVLSGKNISSITHECENLRVIILIGDSWKYYKDHPWILDPNMIVQDGRLTHPSALRFGGLRTWAESYLKVFSKAFSQAFDVENPLTSMDEGGVVYQMMTAMVIQNPRSETYIYKAWYDNELLCITHRKNDMESWIGLQLASINMPNWEDSGTTATFPNLEELKAGNRHYKHLTIGIIHYTQHDYGLDMGEQHEGKIKAWKEYVESQADQQKNPVHVEINSMSKGTTKSGLTWEL